MAKIERMPAVELPARDGDLHLTSDQYLRLSLFAKLGRKPNLEKFPGTLVVRRYGRGEVICRQGEPGWTAFWILTTDDALALRENQLQDCSALAERRALEHEVTRLRQRMERLRNVPPDGEPRTAALVYLGVSQIMARLRQAARTNNKQVQATQTITMAGSTTAGSDSLRPLREGELFGEMSCLYRSPRSATIVTRRECYVVEMLRNILDQIVKDPKYKAQADEVYKKRILELHLRKLSIFASISDREFTAIRDSVELLSVEPGDLIFDENERSDSLYIVRSGLVKVLKSVSSLLATEHVRDWARLWALLREDESQAAPARSRLSLLLPEPVRALARHSAPELLSPQQLQEVVHGLNDVIRTPKLVDIKEFQEAVAKVSALGQAAQLQRQRQDLLKKKQDWPPQDNRRFNRLLLEEILPGVLQPGSGRGGPEWILSYCGQGDYFGEMGLILGRPRTATCVAFGHPNDCGVVELVRLSGEAFNTLLASCPSLRQKVDVEVRKRREHIKKEAASPVTDDGRQVLTSKRFEDLGLIQGQKLMLIDLDRCTRCDECVHACVATHTDGNTRLFLDGPRFGKYLVPTSCRACLDPVCMIGCPVGSIHRGANREIIIEDWCIGCGLCADECPYGSIQMHDLGIVPQAARAWRYMPASAVTGDRWLSPGFHDAGWMTGAAPFRLDRDLRDQLAARTPQGVGLGGPINFRHEFSLERSQLGPGAQFRVELTSLAPLVRLWLNGRELTSDDKPKRDGRREFSLPPRPKEGGEVPSIRQLLRTGANSLAVQVAPTAKSADILLQARFDEVRRPQLPEDVDEKTAAEITQKLVTERAVVCDLCSTLSGRKPACVQACPHDAAMRVDARWEFPAT
jgi:CRP-like cAMP-binding protein